MTRTDSIATPKARSRLRLSGLSSRLILAVVVFVVVMTAAYYWLVHRPLYEQMRGLDEVEARLIFRGLRNQLRIDFGGARDELTKTADLSSVRGLEKVALDEALSQAEKTTTVFEKFSVLDMEGRVVSRPSDPASVGGLRADRDYFAGTIRSGRLYVGDPRPFGDGLSLSIGVPIPGEAGSARGVLAGHVLLTGDGSRLCKAAAHWPSRSRHEAILLSRSGYRIARSAGPLTDSALEDLDHTSHPLFGLADYKPVARPYSLDGVEYWGLVCRLPESDWILILQFEQGPVLARVDSHVNRIALVFGLVFVGLLGAFVYYGAGIIRPIGWLTSALARFGSTGAAEPLTKVGVVGEVGDAVEAFNQMIVDRSLAETELRLQGAKLQAIAEESARLEHRMRHEIAGELHDHISQNLAAAKIRLELLRGKQSGAEREDSLNIAVGLMRECIDSVSTLTSRLVQPAIEQLGLVKALEALVVSYEDQGDIQWRFDSAKEQVAVDPTVADVVYRGVGELLHNVVKHAEAGSVRVSLDVSEGQGGEGQASESRLHVCVKDDGVGFRPGPQLPREGQVGGFGLFSLQERVRQVGGFLDIESAPDGGSSATISVPLHTSRPMTRMDINAR